MAPPALRVLAALLCLVTAAAAQAPRYTNRLRLPLPNDALGIEAYQKLDDQCIDGRPACHLVDGGAVVFDCRAQEPPCRCDNATDDTAALQAAMDDCHGSGTRSGIVQLPQGRCRFSQLRAYAGCTLQGVGMGVAPQTGTSLVQMNGVNASAIVNDPTALPPTGFWHWSAFRDFDLRKETPVTDTLGSGIDVDVQTGEGFRLEHVQVSNFPHSGVRLRHGGTTPFVEDVHLHCNGQYGLSYEHDGRGDGHGGGFVWHTVGATLVSGDGNGTALIGVKTAANTNYEAFAFRDVKAENSSAFAAPCGTQDYVIELDDLNSAHVYLENVAVLDALDDLADDGVVHILTSNAAVQLSATAKNVTNLIDDDVAGVAIADDNGVLWLAYSGGVCAAMTTSGMRVGTGAGCAAGLGTAETRTMLALGSGTTAGYLATDVTTNTTNKFGKYGFVHYTNAEEPLCGLTGFSTVNTGAVAIGGSTTTCNAATQVQIWAAATNTTTIGSQVAVFDVNGLHPVPPAAQTIAAGNTVTADACGGTKRLTAAGPVTTDTTNTFTAPATAGSCNMLVCNTSANAITLDANANFKTASGANVVLTDADDCVHVGSDGTVWRQLAAVVAGA